MVPHTSEACVDLNLYLLVQIAYSPRVQEGRSLRSETSGDACVGERSEEKCADADVVVVRAAVDIRAIEPTIKRVHLSSGKADENMLQAPKNVECPP